MNLFYYLHQGGSIMYILLFINILGFCLIIYKFFEILYFNKNHHLIIKDIKTTLDTSKLDSKKQLFIITLLKDTLSYKMQKLSFGLNTIKIIAAISPLLGLLGTALGIFSCFLNLGEHGQNAETIFASGISLALLTTLAGLIVALPHFIAYNYLLGMIDNLESFLDSKLVLLANKEKT